MWREKNLFYLLDCVCLFCSSNNYLWNWQRITGEVTKIVYMLICWIRFWCTLVPCCSFSRISFGQFRTRSDSLSRCVARFNAHGTITQTIHLIDKHPGQMTNEWKFPILWHFMHEYTNLNNHNHNFNGAAQIQCWYSKEKYIHDLLENQHNIYVDSIALFRVAGETTRNTLF